MSGKSNAVRRPSLLFALLLWSLCIDGHAQPTNEVLKPGDPDYPLLNPAPSQVVQFTVITPPSLSAEFYLRYVVEASKDPYPGNADVPLHSPPGCTWTHEKQFHVDLPLTLKKAGDRYTGSFSPDLFQPGNCRWHLDRITSSITNSLSPLVFFNHSFHTKSRPLPGLDFTTDVIHLWCTRKQQQRPPRAWLAAPNLSINCVPLSMIGFWTAVPLSPGLKESVPAEQRRAGSEHINQFLKTLTIEFHDFDAYAVTYIDQSRQHTSRPSVP
jgi:hypothetical protein